MQRQQCCCGVLLWCSQHYVKNLADRAVAYLNVDLAFEGKAAMRARALPILHDFVYDVAKRVIIITACTIIV